MAKIEGIGKYAGSIDILKEIAKHDDGIMLTALQKNLEMGPNTSYKALDYLLERGLVVQEYVYNRRIFTLTEKGKRVAELLNEIGRVMEA